MKQQLEAAIEGKHSKLTEVYKALETECQIILKGTKVDGIYETDPEKDSSAKKFSQLSYMDVVAKKLGVMDATAITMCMEAGLPIKVFKLKNSQSILNAIADPSVGTTVRT